MDSAAPAVRRVPLRLTHLLDQILMEGAEVPDQCPLRHLEHTGAPVVDLILLGRGEDGLDNSHLTVAQN
jgi:hypothetical protein